MVKALTLNAKEIMANIVSGDKSDADEDEAKTSSLESSLERPQEPLIRKESEISMQTFCSDSYGSFAPSDSDEEEEREEPVRKTSILEVRIPTCRSFWASFSSKVHNICCFPRVQVDKSAPRSLDTIKAGHVLKGSIIERKGIGGITMERLIQPLENDKKKAKLNAEKKKRQSVLKQCVFPQSAVAALWLVAHARSIRCSNTSPREAEPEVSQLKRQLLEERKKNKVQPHRCECSATRRSISLLHARTLWAATTTESREDDQGAEE
jgi:hypothetical protein